MTVLWDRLLLSPFLGEKTKAQNGYVRHQGEVVSSRASIWTRVASLQGPNSKSLCPTENLNNMASYDKGLISLIC